MPVVRPRNSGEWGGPARVRFARWVFWIAGLLGIAVLAPMYVLEARLGQMYPPAVTHPEFYYGFAGVTLAWQFVFLMIGANPVRYRPLMPAAILPKLLYAIAIFALAVQNRIAAPIAMTGIPDLVLACLFAMAWARTPKRGPDGAGKE